MSPGLFNSLKPVANAYARAAGYRKVGLKYDDLIMEERYDVEKVSSGLLWGCWRSLSIGTERDWRAGRREGA